MDKDENHEEDQEGSNKNGDDHTQKNKGRLTRKKSASEHSNSPQQVAKPRAKLTTNKSVDYNSIDPFSAVASADSKPLLVVKRKPLYDAPFYFNPQLDTLTSEERAKVIYRYHLTILKRYDVHQRKSIFPAEWGKPIPTSKSFSDSLDVANKNKSFQDSQASSDEEQVFTSRAGRLCKRKLYREPQLSDAEEEEEVKKKKSSTPSSPGASTTKKSAELAKKYANLLKMQSRSAKILEKIDEI